MTQFTPQEENLIALALDMLASSKTLSELDQIVTEQLLMQFDKEDVERVSPRIHLVYDRESNIRPLVPK